MGRRMLSWRTGKILGRDGPECIADTLFGPHKHRSGESLLNTIQPSSHLLPIGPQPPLLTMLYDKP